MILSGVKYTIKNPYITGTPFNLSNDYVEYFYYPTDVSQTTSNISFSMIKENQTIVATSSRDRNTQNSSNIQVPKLTISTWSGLAIQCYLITNNLACTLIIPGKYTGSVEGLAVSSNSVDDNQHCNQSKRNYQDTCIHCLFLFLFLRCIK